jgi:hypothetical protein
MTGNIVWIASYPKSGNTWFRAFIANLVSESGAPAHINSLPADNGNSRALFDAVTGVDSANLFPEEVDRLRPGFYEKISASPRPPHFLKIHGAYQHLPDGQAVFPPEATRCAIYIARNPLDVATSFSHFLHDDLDQVIAGMNEDEYVFNLEKSNITNALSLKYSSWSGNVLSWLDAPSDMKVHLMRYEDMLRAPAETFGKAVRAIGLDKSEDEIRRAIALSSFDTLKEMELKDGFREKPPQANAFFREGKSGSWKASLNRGQISALVEKHQAVMRRLGYLDAQGNVVDR